MKPKADVQRILSGAYRVVVTEGMNGLTARAVAKASNMSTQPIYFAFRNMDDLRERVIEQIYLMIQEDYFEENRGLAQFLGNYYRFSVEHTAIYFSLIFDQKEIRQRTESLFYTLLTSSLEGKAEKLTLSDYERKFLLTRIQSMMMSILETPELLNNQPKVEKLLKQTIDQDVATLLGYREMMYSN